MQVNNPLQMNDWKIRKFHKLVLITQLALWGVMGLDVAGLQIPIIRQLIGFIYLIFIPGSIILRILKLHKLGNIETLLYAVGLSIATLMLIGLFMNMVYPFIGISGPISSTPLIITMGAVVLCLCYISYKRDGDFSDPGSIDLGALLSLPAFFLSLIPFLAIFGTYQANFYHNNSFLMFLLVVIAIIVVLIGFDKFIPKKLYPFAVFTIAVSLLLHNSLISMYIWGWDIHLEHYLCNLVETNAMWDPTISMAYNGMLSIVMLAPIFSNVCNISLTWVFKIIYPTLFSLVPLGLYRVFQKQTNDKIAFLSCFFFMSLFVFYTEMLALARQQIAELFLILLMLLMIDKNMDRMKKTGLFIIFAFSLAVSHYGLSYIFMFSLIVVCGLFFLDRWRKNQDNITKTTITPKFVALYVTFATTWYIYVSDSSVFIAIVSIGDHIASSIFTEFLNPETAEGIDIMTRGAVSPLHSVTKYLHLISQFFIAIGILTSLLKRKEMKFEKEYTAFSYVNFMICFAGIAIPFFASSLNTTRLYQITLIFLAPFCVIGGMTFFRMVNHVAKKSWTDRIVKSSLRILSVFFAIFLLFNSGWVYEVAKDHPGSISLSPDAIPYLYTHEQDMVGAEWLSGVDDSAIIYGDYFEWLMLSAYGFFPMKQIIRLHEHHEPVHIGGNAYIYVRYGDVVTYEKGGCEDYTIYGPKFFQYMNKIYDDGCVIYR